jgi:hypothetical protein
VQVSPVQRDQSILENQPVERDHLASADDPDEEQNPEADLSIGEASVVAQ